MESLEEKITLDEKDCKALEGYLTYWVESYVEILPEEIPAFVEEVMESALTGEDTPNVELAIIL
ncbi:MAG: hypothetical protein DGJ47_000427 [Rickettsiaceae bacterium]